MESQPMRGKWFTVIASLTLILLVVLGAYLLRSTTTAKQSPPPPPAPAVYAGSDVTLEGKVRAPTVHPVPAPIEGRIEAFHAEVGDQVYEGQLLAIVKSQGLEVARERAAADLERVQSRVNDLESALIAARLEASRAGADASRARSEYERTEKLFERQRLLLAEGATPRLHFEKAQREYESAKNEFEGLNTLAQNAESRLTQLQKDVDTAHKALEEKNKEMEDMQAETAAGEVHAPVGGIVVARRGQQGDDVDRSMPDLFQIATDLSRLEVLLEPPPPVLVRIKTGQSAAVQIAENAGDPLAGVVKSLEQGRVVVEFANPNPAIKPGLTANVRILLGAR